MVQKLFDKLRVSNRFLQAVTLVITTPSIFTIVVTMGESLACSKGKVLQKKLARRTEVDFSPITFESNI